MSKAEILDYFYDINVAYNDCSRHDSLSNMLDEFEQEIAERIEKRIKEEASLLEQERNEAREYDDEQIIFAVNNQLRAFDYSLRVIAEELKGGE